MEKFEQIMLPLAEKLDRNRYLSAIKSGFFLVMPLLIIGSMFLLFSQIPSESYQSFMQHLFGEGWDATLIQINNVTMGCMTFFVIIGMSYDLAKYYQVDGISSVVVSLASFLTVTELFSLEEGTLSISLNNLGASGLFVGMIVAIIATEVFRWSIQKKLIIKMPDSVPENVSKSFSALIPGFLVIILFAIIRVLFALTAYGSIQNFIFDNLQTPLLSLGSSYPATLLILLIEASLWVLGIHGSNIVLAVMQPIWIALATENAQAFAAGKALPHIVNYQFYNNFIKLGGSSATIGLAIACLFLAKSTQYKTLGKLAIIPAVFNINEPLIFGVPIVLNPMMMLPFILSPLIMCTLGYFSMKLGLVPITNGLQIPWTTPPILAGFLISGWKGALLNIVQILVSAALYLPFFRVVDQEALDKEREEG
jgi:PTS system cellobiose-specific IIC component